MRQIIHTSKAPGAIGPYVQGNAVFGTMVFTSGQIAIIPETGELAEGGIEAQTKQVMENLKAILEAAGTKMDQVIKTTCFLSNMDDFQAFNEVYAGYFNEGAYPSRSAIEISRLPKGALIEVEAIALV